MLGASCLFIGFAGFALALPLIEPRNDSLLIALLGALVFGSFATFSLRSYARVRDRVAVNSEGIWYMARKGTPTFIAWRDVASVKVNDTQQRLVLVDGVGRRTIKLEYQLEDFGKLRDFVLCHTVKQTLMNAVGANVFHRTWINKGILLGGAVLFLLFAWLNRQQCQPEPLLFLIGFAAFLLGATMFDPISVVIETNAVVVKYLGWERIFSFSTISGIGLKDVYSRGNVWASVVIARKQGRPIKLYRFREGSVALNDALQTAWRLAGGTTTNSGDTTKVLQ